MKTYNPSILAIFALLGAAIPYAALAVFIARHGLDIPELLSQIFGSPGAAFFALDVIMGALFAIYLAVVSDLDSKRYWVIASALLVGPACALPLYYRLASPRQ